MPERRRILNTQERAASILAAAASVFARQGYAPTTVDQVAAEARVSKLMVYRHFNSKRELYVAILDQVRDRLSAITHPSGAVDPADAEAAIRRATTALAEVFAVAREMPDAFRLMHRYAAHEPEFAEYVEQITDRERRRVEALLASVPNPVLRGWMARLVASTVDEAFLTWLDVGDPEQDAVMVERVAYILAGMVGSLWQPGLHLGTPQSDT
jgi:AcrR family transcriptional regulator